uniref:NADH-ubiquinone oxidoreductase chain 4 n=1 Tax=Nanophyes sp. CG271 TaxID=2480752 RepID=A0A3G2JZF7_9CUCU|nr:NADH dehydrogenase subunit 4 [Nanophyes sp. CG271]
MMKFIISLMFLTILCFFKNYWLVQFMFMFLSFIFMLNMSMNYLFIDLSYNLGMDLLSFSLMLLSFWICALMIMASEKLLKMNYYYNLFLMMMIFLLISLLLTFSTLNLFIFYLFFEISLIPTLIFIIGWGYQPERIEAGMYLLFYTMMASLPMLVGIFYCYSNSFSIDFFMLGEYDNLLLYFSMLMVFLIKMPMFFVHLWLPKAHVEAPVAGSMILAGIMLKLGGYGMLRVMTMFINYSFNTVFISISLIGGFLVSLICLRQSDIKSLIAYSSVVHMGMVLGGIMTLNMFGFWGALVLMLAHGLCSSGLFCLANIVYERVGSRSLYMNKGMLNILPSLALFWFLFCSSNMAAPPSLNLLGEVLLISSLVNFSSVSILMLSFLSFFSAIYSLYLYAFSQHGLFYSGIYSFYLSNYREYLLLLLHWLPLNIMILKFEIFMLWI